MNAARLGVDGVAQVSKVGVDELCELPVLDEKPRHQGLRIAGILLGRKVGQHLDVGRVTCLGPLAGGKSQFLEKHLAQLLGRVEVKLASRVLVNPGSELLHPPGELLALPRQLDRKSTRLNSSHVKISYAVFCL